jgi:hypothetical protein
MNDQINTNTGTDIDALLSELKETKSLGALITPRTLQPTTQPIVNEDNLNEFIMNKASMVIQQGCDALEDIKSSVASGGEAEEIDAYSKLIAAVSSSIDTLNKINLQNKKSIVAKEIKKMDVEMRQGIINAKVSNVTNNIILASREEIMKKLFNEAEDMSKVIDISADEEPLTKPDGESE